MLIFMAVINIGVDFHWLASFVNSIKADIQSDENTFNTNGITCVTNGKREKKNKKREGLGKPSLDYSDFKNDGESFLVLVITISIFYKEFVLSEIHSGENVSALSNCVYFYKSSSI